MLAALALASCASVGTGERDRAIAEYRAQARADSLRYVDPVNRVAVDRGLVYEFKPCARTVFESSTGWLVRHGRGGGPDSVRVSIPADSVHAWLAHADAIDLWAYPADFGRGETLALGPDSSYTLVSPSGRHRLDLRDGDRAVSVRWSTQILSPLSPRATALRAFAARIEDSIAVWERLRDMPDLGYFCL